MLALLAITRAATDAAPAATIARLANQLWPFLLSALDARQASALPPAAAQPAADPDDVEAVEAAAIGLLVAVTLKLSESRFKPLFLRLQAWASVAPPDQPGRLTIRGAIGPGLAPCCSQTSACMAHTLSWNSWLASCTCATLLAHH